VTNDKHGAPPAKATCFHGATLPGATLPGS